MKNMQSKKEKGNGVTSVKEQAAFISLMVMWYLTKSSVLEKIILHTKYL